MCNVYVHKRKVGVKFITKNIFHNVYYSILTCDIVCWKVKRSRIFAVNVCRYFDF